MNFPYSYDLATWITTPRCTSQPSFLSSHRVLHFWHIYFYETKHKRSGSQFHPTFFLEIQKRSSCYRCLPVCHPPPLNPSYIITVFPKFHSPLRFLLSMLSVICKCTQSCIVPLYDLYVYIRAMVGGISLSTPPMSLIVYHFFLFLYFILFSLSFT